MKLKRSLQVALLGAVLVTRALAQTEADVASLLPKAQRGNAIAQYNLGLAYLNGKGVAADPIEAYVWLSLAHEGGFRGKALGVVAGGLEPADFETARKRLADRRAALNLKSAPVTPAKAEPAEPETKELPVVRTDASKPAAPINALPVSAQKPDLGQELAVAVADKQQLSSELAKSWSETELLKKQLAETQAAADFLTAETSKLHGERDTLNSKLNELTREVAGLRNDRDNARALGVQAEATLAQANTEKTTLESSLKEVQNSAATDKKWLSDELTKSFQEVTSLKTQLEAATAKAAASSAAPTYPDLSGKVKELESSLATVSASAAAAKEEATRLADERIAREKQLIGLQQQAAESATAHSALQQEVDTLRRAAATPVAPAFPDLREEVATLKSAAGQAQQQIAALTQAKETAEKNLSRKPAAPGYPDLSGQVKELESSLAGATAEATAAKQEIKNLQRAAATPVAPAYPDLREQVASLESQLSTLKAEGGRARDQITALSLAKAAAEKSLSQVPAAPAYPDLSGKVKELEASLSAVSAKATAAQQEASRLADDRLEREKQLIAVQQQSAELAAARDSLQQEVQTLRQATAAPATPAYPDLREQVASLKAEVVALKTDATEARQQTVAMTVAKTAAEKSLAQVPVAPAYPDLSGKVKSLEADLSALTAKATAAQQEASRLADDRVEREKQMITLQQQSTELAATRDSLQQEVQTLRKTSAAPAAPNYPDLREQVASLESQLAAAKSGANQTPAAAPAYPDLSDKVKELEASLAARAADTKGADELRQAKADAEQKLGAAEQSRTELAQQFEEFKRSALANQRELLNRQAQITMLESEKAALRQQSAADQTRLADLSAQLAASRRKVDEVYPTAPAYPDQRARVEQLEAELTKTNEQANSMVTLLNRSQQEAKAASDEIEKLRGANHELESKLAAAPATTKATAPAYPDLRKQVATLEADLSAAKSAAPAYPDLREKVGNLEVQLEAARALPKLVVTEAQFTALKQELSETKEKLATTLKGYGLIEKERDALAARPAPTSAPDLTGRVRELEAQLAAKPVATAPSYPDLRQQVATLEASLAAAKAAAPAYPDLREQVSNLEIQLEAARALPKNVISQAELNNVKQELAETKEKLATTLKGYSLIEKERDELAAKPDRVGSSQSDVARLTEAYNALQRTNAQNERDLVLLRAQLPQTPGATTAVAQQNPPPRVTPMPVASRVVSAPAAPVTPVVAAAAPAPTRRTHVVAAGDTLVKISQRYYGNTTSWQPIYNANRELLGPNGTLKVGTELRIP